MAEGPSLGWAGVTASLALALCSCDGPKEQVGRTEDRADAAASGLNTTDEGPKELSGEAQDRVDEADREARDASADALEARADQLRQAADVQADQLDQKAEEVRRGSAQ